MSETYRHLPVVGFSDEYTEETVTGEKALRVEGNLNITTVPDDNERLVPYYDSASGVVKQVLTTVITYMAPVGKRVFLQRVTGSGTNIATYQVEINSAIKEKRRTYFSGPLTTDFEFSGSSESGVELDVGDVVTLRVEHNRPNAGDFEGTIKVLEIG